MSTQCGISCHPYRSIRKQIWPCHKKWSGSTQGHHLIKAPGHGHTTTWYKFWQHFKAFIIPIILYQFQKDHFCLIILYDILLYFIYVYIAPLQEETILWDIFFMETERSYQFDHWLHVSKKSPALWFYAYFFSGHVHSPWASADDPSGQKFWCQQESLITLIICCKFKKHLFNLCLYTHIFMI